MQEVKAEIQKASAELDVLQDSLPACMAVGVAFVNMLKVVTLICLCLGLRLHLCLRLRLCVDVLKGLALEH